MEISSGTKESLLKQIETVEYNMRRLKTLIEADLFLIPDANVALYCCIKSQHQLHNLETEIANLDQKKLPDGK